METEEMQMLWQEMSSEREKQKKITDSLIISVTQAGYRSKINRIIVPEILGSLVCFAAVVFILARFQQLNTWYLVVCGIVAVIILFLLPVLSLNAIRAMRAINISANTYKQSLLAYAKATTQFVSVQKASYYLAAILMVIILPVMVRLMGGGDLFKEARLWIWYAVGFPFFYIFCRWVFKSYIKIMGDAQNVLKELED